MNFRADRYAVLAVVLCVVIFAGEAATYAPGIHEYGASAEWDDGRVDYEVSSSGSDVFSAILLDRNGSDPVESLHVFVDENYDRHFSEASKGSLEYMDPEYYYVQIREALSNRSMEDVESLDSGGLTDFVNSTMDNPKGHGILVTSYAMPSAVYTGSGSDPIVQWIRNGGTLYWLGSEIGKYYSDADSLHEVESNQQLFFGRECINTGDNDLGLDVVGKEFTDAFSLKSSNIRFALDADGLEDGLEMGYGSDGYASTAMAGFGKGVICVFSGTFEVRQIDDIGQVIAAGITPTTEIVEVQTSQVTRGTESGSITFTCADPALYICIGGTYTKYGGLFHV